MILRMVDDLLERWSLEAGCQAVALSDGRVLVVHPRGSFVLRIEGRALEELFDEASAKGVDVASQRLSVEARADARSLLEGLGRGPTPARDASIYVVGNGPWSAALAEQLGDRLGRRVLHVPLATRSLEPARWRFPPGPPIAQLCNDAVAPTVFMTSDVVICALENVSLASFAALNRLALEGRAAVIFPFFERGLVRIAPVVYDGTPPCFFCERVRALGLDATDPLVEEALEGLAVDGPEASSAYTEEACRLALVEDILRLLADGVPRAPGTTLLLADGALPERSPVAPLPGCPGCSQRRRPNAVVEHVARAVDTGATLERDDVVERTIRELDRRGAGAMGHAVGTFLDHLRGTWKILASWGEAEAVSLAGLCHSVYGSDVLEKALFQRDRRHVLQALIGQDAEELVHLFSSVDRRRLWDSGALVETTIAFRTGHAIATTPEQRRCLAVVDLANTAEQLAEDDRSPGLWLADAVLRARSLGADAPPPFRGPAMGLDEEKQARLRYQFAIANGATEPALAFEKLVEARVLNPIVGETSVLAAELAARLGRADDAVRLAREGAERLRILGTSWDKRRSSDEWVGRALRIARAASATMAAESIS